MQRKNGFSQSEHDQVALPRCEGAHLVLAQVIRLALAASCVASGSATSAAVDARCAQASHLLQANLLALGVVPRQDRAKHLEHLEPLRVAPWRVEERDQDIGDQATVHAVLVRVLLQPPERLSQVLVQDHSCVRKRGRSARLLAQPSRNQPRGRLAFVAQLANQQVLVFDVFCEAEDFLRVILSRGEMRLDRR